MNQMMENDNMHMNLALLHSILYFSMFNMATSEVLIAKDVGIQLQPSFDLHPSIDTYKRPYKKYLEEHPVYEIVGLKSVNVVISWIIVGALTFHPTSNPPRILLIQRSATDSMPHRWETPGGGCDESDESILYSVARELKEETSLVPRIIGPAVGKGYTFNLGPGRATLKLNFIVELEVLTGIFGEQQDVVNVKLDPDEHQAFVWVTEEEVRHSKVGELDIVFTSNPQKDVILEAFEVRRLG